MQKIGIYLLYGAGLTFALILIFSSSKSANKETQLTADKASQETENQNKKSAEKIEIVHFHATQQCHSCITVGQYAKKTVEENFPEEYKSGKIEFKDINLDLSQNKEIARKFGATGSSLFINAISAGKDNIQEDVKVWRLISNEQAFLDYLSEEIKSLL